MRIILSELTLERIIEAGKRRLENIPDILAWRYSQYTRENVANLSKYRNIHKGKRCFVIANGPSLQKMDISVLRNEFTFSMNRAYLLYNKWGFIPSYFVCINELVLEQFAADIARLQMPKFINFNRRRLFKNYERDDSILYLRLGLQFRDRFSDDLTRVVSSGGTVTFACLQLAYFMGFSEVILIGLDHSFVGKGIPSKTEVRSEERDESHCHPDYFPKGSKWQLPDLYRSELAYALARKAFVADGRSILDATTGGKCEIFQKVEFKNLFT
jgi:hypothetical protein